IQNIISAFEFSLNETVHNISLSKICSIALYGYESGQSIREREKAIFLGRFVSNLKKYNPIAPERILPAIADISAFLQNNDKIDILVRAALAHYQFEMIHPYECYNGIVGRIMIPMILRAHGGIKAASFIGVSEYLYFCKNDYFEILRSTQYSGGYIALIKFFVRAIYESAKIANTRIEHILRIFTDDEKRISAANASNKVLPMVYDSFKSRIYSQVRMVSNDLGISFNTATKLINILCELNILQLENVQSRHRVFVYNRLLDTLSEGVITE
ncbi:MAG: Fic family protein, partial [Oscillospiraceae bacterium]|nr:Fic family protein [Oscillospiraceae bacterium]